MFAKHEFQTYVFWNQVMSLWLLWHANIQWHHFFSFMSAKCLLWHLNLNFHIHEKAILDKKIPSSNHKAADCMFVVPFFLWSVVLVGRHTPQVEQEGSGLLMDAKRLGLQGVKGACKQLNWTVARGKVSLCMGPKDGYVWLLIIQANNTTEMGDVNTSFN